MNASFNLNPANFVIVSGIIQCFLISIILFFRRVDRVGPNRLLAGIIVFVSLHLAYLMILDLNLEIRYRSLLCFPYSFLLGIGPLIFFYTKSLIEPDFCFNSKDFIHFIPLLLEVMVQIIQIIYSSYNGVLYYNVPTDSIFTIAIYLLSILSILYYLKRSLSIIKEREKWLLTNLSNLQGVTLKWLYVSLRNYRIIWMLWIPFAILFLLIFRFQWQYLVLVVTVYGLMIAITYLMYWMGMEGFRYLDIIPYQNQSVSKNSSYTNLPNSVISGYQLQITELMDTNQLYLDENLDLKKLSLHLSLDPNLVSYILNQHFSKNFYEFVNEYRVEEVKRRIMDSSSNHLTILGIALESGFNSKTSFNRVFKQLTGITPSQFQKEHQKKG